MPLSGYFSRERREQRRRLKSERDADKTEVRRRKLLLAEAKQERKLNETRRRIGMVGGMAAAPASMLRTHRAPHREPSHHVGSCDAACRAGLRAHSHRED